MFFVVIDTHEEDHVDGVIVRLYYDTTITSMKMYFHQVIIDINITNDEVKQIIKQQITKQVLILSTKIDDNQINLYSNKKIYYVIYSGWVKLREDSDF